MLIKVKSICRIAINCTEGQKYLTVTPVKQQLLNVMRLLAINQKLNFESVCRDRERERERQSKDYKFIHS